MTPTVPTVNTPVRLAFRREVLPSRVEDQLDTPGGTELVLAAPEGITPPAPGTPLTVHWSSHRGACELAATFVGVGHDHLPLWRVQVSGSVSLVQRRQFARARAEDSQVALIPIQSGITAVRSGELIDIGEGGARCVFPAGQVRVGGEAELHLDLGGQSLIVVGEVLRVESRHDGTDEVTVTYTVPERVGDTIRAYVFSRQRREQLRTVRR